MPNIDYVFVESGKESVKGAFREIGGEARSAKRDVDAALKAFEQLGRIQGRAGGARAGRVAGAPGATTAERQAAADETRRQNQALRDRQSYQDRLAKEVAAGQKRREREAQREQAKTFKEQDRARTYQERLAKEVAATQQRRERENQKLQARTAKEQERDLNKHRAGLKRDADERARDRAREHRATLARQAAERAAERRGQTEAERAAKRKAAEEVSLHRERKRLREKGLFGEIGGQLKGAVIGAGLAAGAVGIGVTGAAARDALRVRELANRISINSRQAGQEAIDPSVLQREFERIAIGTPGQTAVGVGEALQGFVTKTGRADVGRQSLGTFATVASATGSDIRDVSNAAADLFQKFDITSMEDMREALAALTMQGKEGAFELKDAAGQFARLSAAASRFGIDKGVSGVRTLGGLTQIARSATGSSEQASTAVEATLRQLIAKSGAIKKDLGVNVFAKGSKSKTRDVRDVLVDVIAKSKGELPKLQQIFGEEGIRGVSPLISTFNQARNAATGTEAEKTAAGVAALREQLRKAIDAPGDWAEIQKDAAQAQQDASAKLTASWERLQSKVGDAVLPALADLVDKFANSPEMVDAFVGTIEVMIEAMKGFVLVLEDLGLVKKRTKSPEQIEKEKREQVQSIDKQIAAKEKEAGGTQADVFRLQKEGKLAEAQALQQRLASPEMLDLQAKRQAAARRVGEAQAETERVQDIQQRIRTPEQFAAEYAALADPNTPKRMLAGGKAGAFAPASVADESAAQKEFRLAQDQAKTEERTRLGVGEGQQGVALAGKGLLERLATLEAAAARAAQNLDKIAAQAQASPIGPT